jgi:hypothetical protein
MESEEGEGDAELAAAAKELLQGDEEMQTVHSKQSVTVMMKAARDKIVDERGKGQAKPSYAANEVSLHIVPLFMPSSRFRLWFSR